MSDADRSPTAQLPTWQPARQSCLRRAKTPGEPAHISYECMLATDCADKTTMEALRCLKRRLSDVVCQQMRADAKRLATG